MRLSERYAGIERTVLRVQAADAARQRITIKKEGTDQDLHRRLIQFLTFYNDELSKRGLDSEPIILNMERQLYRDRYKCEPDLGV